jgi:hypothetical protein
MSEKVEKIEVTPEMIRAGGSVYLREHGFDSWQERVTNIYRAMERKRRSSERVDQARDDERGPDNAQGQAQPPARR